MSRIDESSERRMTVLSKVVELLRSAGVDGVDQDDLPGFRELEDCDADEITAAVAELRADGTAEPIGCTWVRLSLRTWSRAIAQRHGLSDAAADGIGEMLRGRGSLTLRKS